MNAIKFSLKEVLSICVVVFSISASIVWLKSDISQMKQHMNVIRIDVAHINKNVSELSTNQVRLDMVVNFLYAEALKSGWEPSAYTYEEWGRILEKAKSK